KPWVRDVAARMLGSFKEDATLAPRLSDIASNDPAYRVRAAALLALADIKAPNIFDTLVAELNSDSPDGILCDAALGGLGTLGDNRAVPILMEWSGAGKPLHSREEAVAAIAGLDKKNKDITLALL